MARLYAVAITRGVTNIAVKTNPPVKKTNPHVQSCHNGWASNISIVMDTGCAGTHHSKYMMSIDYDMIEDGKTKHPIVYSLDVGP